MDATWEVVPIFKGEVQMDATWEVVPIFYAEKLLTTYLWRYMFMLRREKGFTLIELLIVVAIIGIIAAIAVPNLLTAIQRSKRSRSQADLRALGTALGSYQVDYNDFPVQTAAAFITLGSPLPRSYFEGSTTDGWGTQYRYVSDGDEYTMCSYGKNEASGGTASDFDWDVIFRNGALQALDSAVTCP